MSLYGEWFIPKHVGWNHCSHTSQHTMNSESSSPGDMHTQYVDDDDDDVVVVVDVDDDFVTVAAVVDVDDTAAEEEEEEPVTSPRLTNIILLKAHASNTIILAAL